MEPTLMQLPYKNTVDLIKYGHSFGVFCFAVVILSLLKWKYHYLLLGGELHMENALSAIVNVGLGPQEAYV